MPIIYTEDKVGVVFVSRNVNFRNKSWVADTARKWVIDGAESYIREIRHKPGSRQEETGMKKLATALVMQQPL